MSDETLNGDKTVIMEEEDQEGLKTKIGKYELVTVLGRGGMGTVYLAKDPVLDRFVAIKSLTSLGEELASSQQEQFIDRFIREAQAIARLDNEYIVTIHDIDRDKDNLFIVMEYVEGESIATLVASKRYLPLETKLEFMIQMCRGVSVIHKAGLIHRDIKPDNIMITREGALKIMDFGTVRTVDSDLTRATQILGTPSYMAPEQIQGVGDDHRSDIFSLGAVMYFFLTGEKAFPGDTFTSISYKIAHENPSPPSKINTLLPQELDLLVFKAMAKSPQARYQSCEDFIQAMEDFLQGRSVEEGAPPPKKIGSGKKWFLGLGVLAVAAVAALFLTGVIGPWKDQPVKTDKDDTLLMAENTPTILTPAAPEGLEGAGADATPEATDRVGAETEAELESLEAADTESASPGLTPEETPETQPEVAEAETAGPEETTEPEITEPETAEPEQAVTETGEPETVEPEVAEPETAEPEVAESEAAAPDTVAPEGEGSETLEPEAAEIEESLTEVPETETAEATEAENIGEEPTEPATDAAESPPLDPGTEDATQGGLGVLVATGPEETPALDANTTEPSLNSLQYSELYEAPEVAPGEELPLLPITLSAMARTRDGKGTRSLGQGDVLHPGDQYKLSFTADQDSHVYIFLTDGPEQGLVRLFPVDYLGVEGSYNSNPVRKGRTYILPSEDMPFIVSDEPGPRRLLVLTFPRENSALETIYAELKAARSAKEPERAQEIIRDLLTGLRDTHAWVGANQEPLAAIWTPGQAPVDIMAHRLNEQCADCVYELNFSVEQNPSAPPEESTEAALPTAAGTDTTNSTAL